MAGDAKANANGPVGIITRADSAEAGKTLEDAAKAAAEAGRGLAGLEAGTKTGLDALRNLSKAFHDGARGAELDGPPDEILDAASTAEALVRSAVRNAGKIRRRHRGVARATLDQLLDELHVHERAIGSIQGQIRHEGRAFMRSANVDEVTRLEGRLSAHRRRAEALRVVVHRLHGTPVAPLFSVDWALVRRITFGRPGRALRFAQGAGARARGALAAFFEPGYMAGILGSAAGTAEDYETEMARLAIQRDLDGKTGSLRTGVDLLRSTLGEMRTDFDATGRETLGVMRALGHRFDPARGPAAIRFARRTGLDSRSVAGASRRMLDYVGPAQGAGGRDLLGGIGAAMRAGGMRDRPQEFLADAEGYAQALGSRAGSVAPDVVAGYAGWAAQAGIGGSAYRHIGQQLIAGSAAQGEDALLSAKLAAVRRLGPVQFDGRALDPRKSTWDAMLLIQSGGPRVQHAFYLQALEEAGRHGLGASVAKRIFGRLTGLDHVHVEKLWPHLAKLGDVGAFARGPDLEDGWREGPMHRRDGAGTSLAGLAAEADGLKHDLGRPILRHTVQIKEALAIVASGLGRAESVRDLLMDALARLDPDTRAILALHGVMRGGTAGKALAATVGVFEGKRALTGHTGAAQRASRATDDAVDRASEAPVDYGPPLPAAEDSADWPRRASLSRLQEAYGLVWNPTPGNNGRLHVDRDWMRRNIDYVQLHTGQHVNLHRDVAQHFVRSYRSAVEESGYLPRKVGSFVARHANWNEESGPSTHAYGLGVDIYPRKGDEALPMSLVEAMERRGWVWGGRWKDHPDPTHFEWRDP